MTEPRSERPTADARTARAGTSDARTARAGTARVAVARGLAELGAHPLALWSAFGVIHLWLIAYNLLGPGLPLGDVTLVYRFWVEQGLIANDWVGIDSSWVYPIVALVPMLAAYVLGPDPYPIVWLVIVMLMNAGALLVIAGAGRRVRDAAAAWWWMLFLLALGPIALGRIDSITAPLAVAAVALLARHPRTAAGLLALAAWIKVWPAAILLAAVIGLRERARVVLATVAVTMVVVAGGLAVGAGASLLSPLTEQSGRGLQVEAPLTTPWLWAAWAGEWSARVYYDRDILTWQVFGEGSQQAAALATPLLAIVVLAIVALGLLALRAGAPEARLVPALALALVAALIVVNKVGSPQFGTWLAAPVVLGILWRARGGASFAVPAGLALAIGALTQAVYPFQYGELLGLQTSLVVILTLRNALDVVLLVWAVVAVVRAWRSGATGAEHPPRARRGTLEVDGPAGRARDREPHS
ncbi:glycosyltransferase 87 family protein [Yonghaparkia sp. Root332]|uniref:glycosyltransferase 87 family protein n=1 Tax=Yonghaparkia sp. Root332 TaxID=1736516 RepID=UPI000B276917|nr:glycosyltransferase 87 family protein [Yonghaparkia sp. Root332]